MKKSLLVLVLLFVSILLLATAPVATAKQEKVDICHITGTHDFGQGAVPIGHVINIAIPALPAHIDHGDLEEWCLKAIPDGSEVCTISDSCYQASGGKMIFLTSKRIPINMSEFEDEELEELVSDISDPKAKADAICNYYAQGASLCGDYEAWMAIDGFPAPPPSFPLVRPDNILVAESQDDINSLNGSEDDPICVDEWGMVRIDAQETPRMAWKAIEKTKAGMATCCKEDNEDSSNAPFSMMKPMKCSQVGYAIEAMGVDAFLDQGEFMEKMIKLNSFMQCGMHADVANDLKVRIYCVQQ